MVEQNAFVLHRRPYRENQLLVDLLTEHDGKVTALVYVGQSKRSIKKGLIQPFLPLKVIMKGEGVFKQITQVDSTAKSFSLIKHSLFSAFYINELMIRLLTEHIACTDLFLQYQKTLTALSQGSAIAPQLRYFELSLLEELGLSFDFSPVFEYDAHYFHYIPEQGFVPVYSALPKNSEQCFSASHLQAIAQQETLYQKPENTNQVNDKEPSEASNAETDAINFTFKLLMRHVINQLLGNKPLNSRKLFSKKS
ncbi:DNA repair protein RecO [Colwellia sp. E2M01]|uniref:DNA repair protein RecO n=1 Tax=Colwellia sp. E2M01 TaxID=2841561 RepID=UPI001C081140|nr:DNA repair protein RecO [Colwellia sp. E2M01]MBU2869610.1 DNA repair protein RecO [Colwellia sp. E2M01]